MDDEERERERERERSRAEKMKGGGGVKEKGRKNETNTQILPTQRTRRKETKQAATTTYRGKYTKLRAWVVGPRRPQA